MKDCHIWMTYLQFCLWLAPWHDLLEVCTIQKLFAMQTLLCPAVLSFTLTPQPMATLLWEAVNTRFIYWANMAAASPELRLNEASFPLKPARFSLSSLSTQAENEAFSYDIAKLIMLLYWFCEPLSHWGMCGGWVQYSQCASSNSFSSPGAFVLNLEASDQGWISKGQMCLHILSLMS